MPGGTGRHGKVSPCPGMLEEPGRKECVMGTGVLVPYCTKPPSRGMLGEEM